MPAGSTPTSAGFIEREGHSLSVVVDEAIWWFRGRRWAHLSCDGDLDELHRFAASLGVHRIAFGGDHYDVTDAQRDAALAAGAVPIGARELVRLLRRTGLRRPAGEGGHRWGAELELRWQPPAGPPVLPGGVASALPWLAAWPRAVDALATATCGWSGAAPLTVRLLRRREERALLMVADAPPPASFALPVPPPPISGWWAWPQPDHRLLEVFIRAPDAPTQLSMSNDAHASEVYR